MVRTATAARSAAPRVHWTESRARAVLAELRVSGESVAEFALRNRISRQRLYYWSKRMTLADGPPAIGVEEPAFVAVRLPTSLPIAEPAWIELVVGGTVVRIRESLDVEHAARLVGAIARKLERPC
jgi:hypothetical protein